MLPASEAKGNRGPPFSVSVVIEWENAGRIGSERAERMLRALHAQLAGRDMSLIGPAEIILVYHEQCSVEEAVRAAVAAAGQNQGWRADVHPAPAPCAGYYELKNFGAARAEGDIIILLDSDVVPQSGWLENLISPFRDPRTEVVGGATWVDHRDLYSAAMALGWIFPLAPEDAAVVPALGFAANNVAFRAELRPTMHFPKTKQYRRQSLSVIERLRAESRTLLRSRGAQVTHPPPEGLVCFLGRALWSGYDLSVDERRHGFLGFWSACRDLTRTGAVAIHSVATRFRKVKLGPLQAAGALFVVAAYHGLRGLGLLAGIAAPRLLHRILKRIAP